MRIDITPSEARTIMGGLSIERVGIAVLSVAIYLSSALVVWGAWNIVDLDLLGGPEASYIHAVAFVMFLVTIKSVFG